MLQFKNTGASLQSKKVAATACAFALTIILGAAVQAQNQRIQPPGPPPPGAQPRPRKPFVWNVPGLLYNDNLPTNFAIPPYTSNIVRKRFLASSEKPTVNRPQSATEMIVTKDEISKVFDWYKDKCREGGWTYKTPNSQGAAKYSKTGTLYLIQANKDSQQVIIICNPDKKSGGTAVNINWSRERK